MRYVKYVYLVLFCFLMLGCSSKHSVDELIKVSNVKQSYEGQVARYIETLTLQLPPRSDFSEEELPLYDLTFRHNTEITELFNKHFSWEFVKPRLVSVYEAVFSDDDIGWLISHYQGAEKGDGQGMLEKYESMNRTMIGLFLSPEFSGELEVLSDRHAKEVARFHESQ